MSAWLGDAAMRGAEMLTECAHIELRDGVPFIAGTSAKALDVILNHLIFGWDGRELQRQLPHLTRSQVYAALSYYYDHKAEVDAHIEEGERFAESMRPLLEDADLRARLVEMKRAAGKL